jgi:hypothetical protein
MMSNWKDREAELDKLVADMNSAPPDKKVDAIAAIVTKLVEQRKAMHERMQKMMTEGGKEMMKMGRMMMRMMDKMMGSDQEAKERASTHNIIESTFAVDISVKYDISILCGNLLALPGHCVIRPGFAS